MKLDYRDNALESMRDRKIQPSEVIYTVENPDNTYKNRTRHLTIYEEHPKGRFIAVSVDARNPRWVVSVRDFRKGA